MVRSRIGPFALDSPLGPKGSSFFRAIHVQQRNQVALQQYGVPLGLTADAKRKFLEDIERLKTLRHNHIVRCFGGGVEGSDVYVVYDLVQGESLSDKVARMQRLPWEVALQYGLQICDALQYAHNQGWIHGSLNLHKVLCDSVDESIKLTGFRGEVLRQLCHRPKTVEEFAYLAPEQFIKEATPHPAMDIYSIGMVMYNCLTGQTPFIADSLEHMRYQIQNEVPPQVASVVFDCPVWLSKIVEQLLQKNPVQRPFTAAAVAMALREAEKRAMSGASFVEHAAGGFSPLQLNLDKDEAEKVLGVQKKAKRKTKSSDIPLFERPIVLVASLVLVIGLIIYFMQPLSEKKMYQRAAKLMTNKEKISYMNARDWYLEPMLARYPNGEYSDWAKTQLEMIEMESAEDLMERHNRFNQDPTSEGERRYAEARRYERFGDRITALDRYKAIVELFKDDKEARPFVNLSLRQVAAIEANPPDKAELMAFLNRKLEEAEQLYLSGDVVAAKKIWDSIVSLYNGNAEMVSVVSRAQVQIDRLRDAFKPSLQ